MPAPLTLDSRRASDICAYLAVAAASLIGLWAVSLNGGLFGPDARYMVAAGRWILENGQLPTWDPLTIHNQLPYICQQWPVCILLALVHDLIGETAVRALFAFIDISGALVLYSVSRRVGLRGALATVLSCVAVLWMAVMEASTPRALDVICIALCWGAAARYVETRDPRILATFPLMGFLIANIHGALWPCALMLPLSMLIDARLDARSRGHVALSAALTGCACTLNPYGASMLTLPFQTVGCENPMLAGVWELRPMVPGYPSEALFTFGSCAAALAFSMGRNGVRRLFSYECVMTVGLAVLSLMTRRNLLLYLAVLVLVSGEIVAMGDSDVRNPFKDGRAAFASVLMSCAVLACTVALLAPSIGIDSPRYASESNAFGGLREAGVAAGSCVITDLDTGCNAELLGFRPTLDTRVEVLCGVYGGADVLTPAAAALSGKGTVTYCDEAGIVAAVLPDGSYDAAVARLKEARWDVVHDDGTTIALVSPDAITEE
mgnify:CR=1 FL=1